MIILYITRKQHEIHFTKILQKRILNHLSPNLLYNSLNNIKD